MRTVKVKSHVIRTTACQPSIYAGLYWVLMFAVFCSKVLDITRILIKKLTFTVLMFGQIQFLMFTVLRTFVKLHISAL